MARAIFGLRHKRHRLLHWLGNYKHHSAVGQSYLIAARRDAVILMRYRLRTLLIGLALGPPIIYLAWLINTLIEDLVRIGF